MNVAVVTAAMRSGERGGAEGNEDDAGEDEAGAHGNSPDG